MKKHILASLMILPVMLLSGCGEDDVPVDAADATAGTTAPVTSAVETTTVKGEPIDFEGTDWNNLTLSSAINTVTTYTELDVRAFASACASGVVQLKDIGYTAAWDASYTVIKELIDDAVTLKDLIVLGSATWSDEEKEKAAGAGSGFVAKMNLINSYIEAATVTPEDEIERLARNPDAYENTRNPGDPSMMEDIEETEPTEPETPPTEEGQEQVEEPAAQEQTEIDWNDETFLASVDAFAGFDNETLKRVISVYAAGYQIENECTEEEAQTIAEKACKRAATNATSVKQLMPEMEKWNDSMKTAAIKSAESFIAFANDFQRYSALAAAAPAQEENAAAE